MRVVQISDTRDQQSALLLWKSGKVVYSYLQQCEEAIKQDSGIVGFYYLFSIESDSHSLCRVQKENCCLK